MYAKGNTTVAGAILTARAIMRENPGCGIVAIYTLDGRYFPLRDSRGLGDDVVCVVARKLVRAAVNADVTYFSNV